MSLTYNRQEELYQDESDQLIPGSSADTKDKKDIAQTLSKRARRRNRRRGFKPRRRGRPSHTVSGGSR
ncbi:MAG: hypothetical protein AAFQ40_16665 [Cyanobacteria bacterium J06623_5]